MQVTKCTLTKQFSCCIRQALTQTQVLVILRFADGESETASGCVRARRFFLFYILKKIKISKIYVRFEIFQNYPRSPYGGATCPKCNFFSSNLQRGPWKKRGMSPPQRATGGACRPLPSGDHWAQPTGAAGGPVAPPRGRQAACRPPSGDRGNPPYIRIHTPFHPHLSPKIPQKIQKKERGEEKGSGEALPNSTLVIYR